MLTDSPYNSHIIPHFKITLTNSPYNNHIMSYSGITAAYDSDKDNHINAIYGIYMADKDRNANYTIPFKPLSMFGIKI